MKTATVTDIIKLLDLGISPEMIVNNEKYNIKYDRENPDYIRDIPARYWYMSVYPFDDLGPMVTLLTFNELYERLGTCDIYELIEVDDSIVRERLFAQLWRLYQVDYDVIYNKAFMIAIFEVGKGYYLPMI